jgi:hypothetical protein
MKDIHQGFSPVVSNRITILFDIAIAIGADRNQVTGVDSEKRIQRFWQEMVNIRKGAVSYDVWLLTITGRAYPEYGPVVLPEHGCHITTIQFFLDSLSTTRESISEQFCLLNEMVYLDQEIWQ